MSFKPRYLIYKTVIDNVMADTDHLPSLPALTLRIRKAITDDSISRDKLLSMLNSDPALCALVIRTASCPLYRTRSGPITLRDSVSSIGLKALDNLVMTHSIKSLFIMQSPELKNLFDKTWRRLIIKSCIAAVLAKKLNVDSPDSVLLASLMSEVGTLAVISAFKENNILPETDEYYVLCREYSKSLGIILLNKWQVSRFFIETVKNCGEWTNPSPGRLHSTDVINLALYSILQRSSYKKNLPMFEELTAYKKLDAPHNKINRYNQLSLVAKNQNEIKELINSMY